MRAELLCVGTELLTGKPSTHAAGLSERLAALGLVLARETVVGDDPAEMAAAFKEAWRRSDVVLCAGGLGPTFDDITRDAWSRVLARRLRPSSALLADIRGKFRRLRLPMPPMNRRQALLLSGAEPLHNPHGTAPGQYLAAGRKVLFLLPGPARELFPMVEAQVLPRLAARLPSRARDARTWRLFGAPESEVDRRLRPLLRRERSAGGVEMTWGILAHAGVVDVKAAASGADAAAVKARMDRAEARVRALFGGLIFGTGADELEDAVGRALSVRRETLALAESCTGGGAAERITRVAGSSSYFIQGWVTYADAAKRRLLGVPARVLQEDGAVSAPCALAMARGARRGSGADWALSITGVAGPGGGTARKPVGLVYIGLAGPRGARVWEHRFSGDRARVRERSASWALERLRRALGAG